MVDFAPPRVHQPQWPHPYRAGRAPQGAPDEKGRRLRGRAGDRGGRSVRARVRSGRTRAVSGPGAAARASGARGQGGRSGTCPRSRGAGCVSGGPGVWAGVSGGGQRRGAAGLLEAVGCVRRASRRRGQVPLGASACVLDVPAFGVVGCVRRAGPVWGAGVSGGRAASGVAVGEARAGEGGRCRACTWLTATAKEWAMEHRKRPSRPPTRCSPSRGNLGGVVGGGRRARARVGGARVRGGRVERPGVGRVASGEGAGGVGVVVPDVLAGMSLCCEARAPAKGARASGGWGQVSLVGSGWPDRLAAGGGRVGLGPQRGVRRRNRGSRSRRPGTSGGRAPRRGPCRCCPRSW
ncbi:hypothetical protein SAMN05421874_103140 [Nonomuraea maritima]|uniref:Uncharacterized protein n=1 Tax=Nonomuraea maritima TaxID=683260 RepID=A0A1G8WEW5_9ACTN|nr:hypothetical protein SAMN05421874_103140 [Nonomuraea maritima]